MRTSTRTASAAAAAAVLTALVVWIALDPPWVSEPKPDHMIPRPAAAAPAVR